MCISFASSHCIYFLLKCLTKSYPMSQRCNTLCSHSQGGSTIILFIALCSKHSWNDYTSLAHSQWHSRCPWVEAGYTRSDFHRAPAGYAWQRDTVLPTPSVCPSNAAIAGLQLNSYIQSFICSFIHLLRMTSTKLIRHCITQHEPDSKAQKRTLTAAL